MKTAREAALLALYEIEYNGAYSNIALKNILAELDDSRDRALASALVYGVVSRRITLDYMIEQLSSIKTKKLSKYILLILRMGIYQLKFMAKIPANAAVNESVRLARRYGHKAASGYVNGVLRAAARTDIKIPGELWIKHSFARETAARLETDYAERAESIMAALNKEPKMTVRANALKITREELAERLGGEVCPITKDGIYVRRLDTASSGEYRDGLFTVQDAAPMAAVTALCPKPGETVVDLCAAPGGKTTYLAELMGNKGRIIAFDIYGHKIDLVKKNAERLGIDIIEASVQNAAQVREDLTGIADKVLADVPCSGLGIARRKPEVKYKTDFDGLSETQYKILSAGSKYLKAGGELVYSTCTLYKEENERVVERFLENNSEFELISMKDSLPEGFAETAKGMMTVLPDGVDCDGFFIARLKKVL